MTEKFVMCKNHIPDGMLHDQKLYKISLENGILTLSFNIFLSEEEYGKNDFAKKYFEYKKCHIKCRLTDEDNCDVFLKTTLNKKYKGKFQYISLKDFVAIAENKIRKAAEKDTYPWEYLYTYASPDINSAEIQLSICNDLKYSGAKYSMCTLELYTDEIEYIWE